LLREWNVVARGSQGGVAFRSARALEELGAHVDRVDARHEQLVTTHGDLRRLVRIDPRTGWAPPLVSEYIGLIAAATLLRGSADVPIHIAHALIEGILPGRSDADRVPCADGWLVARWRSASDRRLLEAMVGPLRSARVDDAWAAAREARLLAAPVREEPRIKPQVVELQRPCSVKLAPGRRRIVDWTSLWAGPWATGKAANDEASEVVRIEAPERPDGFLRTPLGRRLWRKWNGAKTLERLDAREAGARERLEAHIAAADVFVFGQTPRVLNNLGFDESWFARHAPDLFRLSLVAYEEPFTQSPGLGEQAAALAGLYWRPSGRPRRPLPWADPLLGAWAHLVLRAHTASKARGGHIRLSLEAAAGRVRLGFDSL
jgi:hypothetical protein